MRGEAETSTAPETSTAKDALWLASRDIRVSWGSFLATVVIFGAMEPWATGTRFASFAERWNSLETCVPDDALGRLVQTRTRIESKGA